MSKLTMDDLTAGQAWGCRFRTKTFCDEAGQPVRAQNLQLGQAHPGTPQIYEGIGVIAQRDLTNRRLIVVDVATQIDFVVEERDAWDYDTVEFKEE